jgi:hypothetical protein
VNEAERELQHHLRAEGVLASRIEQLERETRRLRRINLFILVGAAILLGLGAALVGVSSKYGVPGTVADIVAARQFVLRGPDGAIRGVWGIDKEGALRFVLQDAEARPRARFNLLSDGSSGLTFTDSAGRPRAVFAALPDQSTSIVLADETGKSRVVLGVSDQGAATLVFADRGGGTKAGLGVDRNGSGSFTLLDRLGRAVAPLEAPGASDEVEDSEPAPPAPAPRR